MKRSSEEIDQIVRHAFNNLPDTPPPGSSFDSQRLWGQLHRELHPVQPSRRLIGWWWKAGILVLLAGLGWYVRPLSGLEPKPVMAQIISKQPNKPAAMPITDKEKETPNKEHYDNSERVVRKKVSAVDQWRTVAKVKPGQPVQGTSEPSSVEISAQVLEQETLVAVDTHIITPSPVAEPVVSVKTETKAAKPRFRIVHVNELQTEEEVKTRLYRNEGLVRLGTSSRSFDTPENLQLQIQIPQRIK